MTRYLTGRGAKKKIQLLTPVTAFSGEETRSKPVSAHCSATSTAHAAWVPQEIRAIHEGRLRTIMQRIHDVRSDAARFCT